jgi:hypothetical protein
MTRLQMVDLHVRVPVETKQRAEQMADATAPKGKRGNLGVWVTEMIEAEWDRRAHLLRKRQPRRTE